MSQWLSSIMMRQAEKNSLELGVVAKSSFAIVEVTIDNEEVSDVVVKFDNIASSCVCKLRVLPSLFVILRS